MRHLKLSIEGEIIRAIEGMDLRETSPCSRDQNEFIVPFFFTRSVTDHLLREVDVLASDVNRNYVPGHKKGGSVSFYSLLNQALAILSLQFMCSRCLGGVARERGSSSIMTHTLW